MNRKKKQELAFRAFLKQHRIKTMHVPTIGTWQASKLSPEYKPMASERDSNERLAVIKLGRRLELEGVEAI